jgi:APA family basic amino acid/polyamine antiporter
VLLYYALTNLAALRIPRPQRLFGRWISVAGLVACLGLAWFVEPRVWGLGLVLVAAGLLWFLAAKIRRAT